MDDVGPLALGHKLASVIFRQAIGDNIQYFFKVTGGAEPFQPLHQAAAIVLGGW